MLEVSNVRIEDGGRQVVRDISLKVTEGQIVALLGPNGAGKSELVLGIAGVLPITFGTVELDGSLLNGKGIQSIRNAGIAAVPEGHHVLEGLSVMDNLHAAGPNMSAAERELEVANALEIFPELSTLTSQTAGSLSGGQQQMVAIAQALISRPRFLLIDEMSLGLAPVIIDRLIDVIHSLRNKGIGILLIEQFTQLALSVADYCYVMSQGAIHFQGTSTQLKADQTILSRAYLGA